MDIFQKTVDADFENPVVIEFAMAALARRRAVAERRFVFQPLKRLILFFRRILRKTQPADERFVLLRFKTHAVQTSFCVVGPLDGQRRVLRTLLQTVAEDDRIAGMEWKPLILMCLDFISDAFEICHGGCLNR